MNDNLLPFDIGPLNPSGYGLILSLVCFALVFFPLSRWLLPHAARIQEERAERIEGGMEHAERVRAQAHALREEREALLADARHDAARTRQRAHEEGTALIVAAREDGQRERERILAAGAASIEAERTVAVAALRADAEGWGRVLAERIIGEPLTIRSK
ncbi:F0F1 ATP synthase subunit B family protein [Streptomyces jumonjinensis]|uniref:F0F1 ATP synthase subunit B family protein n=1 Tax=Streptomyces jumonjinensis TaxID=1945 RepID=UPI0037ABE72A